MEGLEIIRRTEELLGIVKVGVLATVDKEGNPHMRWVTPAFVPGRKGFLYAVTSPTFEKSVHIEANPRVEWMLQTRSLDTVANLKGRMGKIDNPSLKAEVFESLGRNMQIFWRVNPKEGDVLVLETELEAIVLFNPMSGEKSVYSFGKGDLDA